MNENKLIMAHIQLPIQIIDNMIEPLQDYLHISFTPCDVLPERTNCNLQTALSDKIEEYLQAQNQFDLPSHIEQLQEETEELVQNINEPIHYEEEKLQTREETPDNASLYITLEELSKKKKAFHHKHSTFRKYPKHMHNISMKRRIIS
jgi:hypothetical protein|uniref:Uncharacterized protein n=1 Tax=viral metagenome TaxID=1070528 RepID=A0A6C0IJH8_9ZZZZ